mmetsp:Transcript_2670/g.4235  ORF Transcript_2670/g.4235 Transcript_2670/m.4235 type:complete len:231 (-) Transcript_2670:211-903(-)
MAPILKLTYFDIQGVAEKIRLAFHLGGVEFQDVRIGFPEWAAMKPTTPYGQLPIMSIDGAPPMAQSDAMLRYAGRLANQNGVLLYGAHNELAIDEAMGLVGDFQADFGTLIQIGLTPAKLGHPEDLKDTDAHAAIVKALRTKWMAESFPMRMAQIAARVESGGFLVGDTVTIADCLLVPTLARFPQGTVDYIDAACMDAYPAVQAYVARFMALPRVSAYYHALAAAKAAA